MQYIADIIQFVEELPQFAPKLVIESVYPLPMEQMGQVIYQMMMCFTNSISCPSFASNQWLEFQKFSFLTIG